MALAADEHSQMRWIRCRDHELARERGALFQSLDGTIKGLNEPIGSLAAYERLMPKALNLMFSNAIDALKSGQSVVFDIARWPWLRELADAVDARVEIYSFEISAEERRRRVQKRNQEKPNGVYHASIIGR